ncbi:MAG: Fic family protein [Deltaproteobacteria bacterium]|nr:Fic family protein [Deltaproteobacteria bacterium]
MKIRSREVGSWLPAVEGAALEPKSDVRPGPGEDVLEKAALGGAESTLSAGLTPQAIKNVQEIVTTLVQRSNLEAALESLGRAREALGDAGAAATLIQASERAGAWRAKSDAPSAVVDEVERIYRQDPHLAPLVGGVRAQLQKLMPGLAGETGRGGRVGWSPLPLQACRAAPGRPAADLALAGFDERALELDLGPHTMRDVSAYVRHQFGSEILRDVVSGAASFELHLGLADQALASAAERGLVVLGEIHPFKSPRTKRIFAAVDPNDGRRRYLISDVAGDYNALHLQMCLRRAGVPEAGLRRYGTPAATWHTVRESLRAGLAALGCVPERAWLGYFEQLKTSLMRRERSVRIVQSLRDHLGPDYVRELGARLRAEATSAPAATRATYAGLVRQLDAHQDLDSLRPAAVFGKAARAMAVNDLELLLVEGHVSLPDSAVLGEILRAGAVKDSLLEPGDDWLVMRSEVDAVRIEIAKVTDDDREARGLLAISNPFQSFYGDLAAVMVEELARAGVKEFYVAGSAGGLGSSALGDVSLPTTLVSADGERRTVDNVLVAEAAPDAIPALKIGTVHGGVVSPVEETVQWLERIGRAGVEAVDVEALLVADALSKIEGVRLGMGHVITDLPGGKDTLDFPNRANKGQAVSRLLDLQISAARIRRAGHVDVGELGRRLQRAAPRWRELLGAEVRLDPTLREIERWAARLERATTFDRMALQAEGQALCKDLGEAAQALAREPIGRVATELAEMLHDYLPPSPPQQEEQRSSFIKVADYFKAKDQMPPEQEAAMRERAHEALIVKTLPSVIAATGELRPALETLNATVLEERQWKDLPKRVFAGLFPQLAKGRYRVTFQRSGKYRAPAAKDVAPLLDIIGREISAAAQTPGGGAPAVDLAALTFAAVVLVHPFMDGNGRTGQGAASFVLGRLAGETIDFPFPRAVWRTSDVWNRYRELQRAVREHVQGRADAGRPYLEVLREVLGTLFASGPAVLAGHEPDAAVAPFAAPLRALRDAMALLPRVPLTTSVAA